MYDFLYSADFVVDDSDRTATQFTEVLGLSEQKPSWRLALERSDVVAWNLRIRPSLAEAPSRLEVLSRTGQPLVDPADPAVGPCLDHFLRFQGPHRPIRTHATVLVTTRFEPIMERLLSLRVPYRLAPTTTLMDFDRIWIGYHPERHDYDPSFDGGLGIEIMTPGPLAQALAAHPKPTGPPHPGEPMRLEARSMIVRDLDAVLRTLSHFLQLEPCEPVQTVEKEGYRRAVFTFGLAASTDLELIEPFEWNLPAARYLATWGPGPYETRIAVHDLDAARDRLDSLGVGVTNLAPSAVTGERPRLQIDPAAVEGALFELIEHDTGADRANS